uniref:Non-structural protein NS1 n=1 Tax=Heramatsu virus TaxID=1416744 RepID=U5XLH1_9REOV|nr:non-structural protein NS1 [Heramatsu virus]
MEHFLRKFNPTCEERVSLETFSGISSEWRCGHRARDCFVNGFCARERFHDAIAYANEVSEPAIAQQVIRCAVTAMHDRDKLWILSRMKFAKPMEPGFQREMNRLVDGLRKAYNQSGIAVRFANEARPPRRARVQVDDSLSFLHLFYIPTVDGRVQNITGVMRFGTLGVVIYAPGQYQYSSPNDPTHARDLAVLRDHVQTTMPACRYTGCSRQIRRLMFVPQDARLMLENEEDTIWMMRHAEADAKFLDMYYKRDFPRFLKQRWGLLNGGMDLVDEFLLRGGLGPRGNRSLLTLRLATEGVDWRHMALPQMIIKMIIVRSLGYDLIVDWLGDGSPCQLCFLAERMPGQEFPIVDVRLAELSGSFEVVTVKPFAHGDDVPRVTALEQREVFRCIGGHWVKQVVNCASEAVIVAAKELQAYVRGEGLWSGEHYRKTMCHLSRCVLYWDLDKRERNIFYRLLCFSIFGAEAFENGRRVNWDDLGTFIRAVVYGPDVPLHADATLARLSIQMAQMYLSMMSQLPVLDGTYPMPP